MSTPVVTEKWAGCFDCDSCRRKRLTANEFSKKAIEKLYRKTGGLLKCKQCVQEAEASEREEAATRKVRQQGPTSAEKRQCAGCGIELGSDSYNRNQWNKGPGTSRCRDCVELAVAEEARKAAHSTQLNIEEARQAVKAAQESGNVRAVLKAESVLSALEAEKVTGLKPQSMSGRRGGGGGRSGRGRGRGRGSSSRGGPHGTPMP